MDPNSIIKEINIIEWFFVSLYDTIGNRIWWYLYKIKMPIYVIYHTKDHKTLQKEFLNEKCWDDLLRLKLRILKIHWRNQSRKYTEPNRYAEYEEIWIIEIKQCHSKTNISNLIKKYYNKTS